MSKFKPPLDNQIIKPQEVTFKEQVRNLFSYAKSPNLAPSHILDSIVKKINKSYKVVGLVGIGLEGAVIKVRDISNAEIALKVASANFSEEGKKRSKIYSLFRFKTETENEFKRRFINGCIVNRDLYGIIRNENIDFLEVPGGVEVFEFPGLYVKMEFVHGPPMLQYLRDNQNFSQSMCIYIQILRSVGFFHDYGFIHRDIKSDNIIITGTTRNKLKIGFLDWTMAKRCGVESGTIAGQMSLGTLGYSSDKLSIDGDAKMANYSDDIYSVGMMLYEFCNFKRLPSTRDPKILLINPDARLQYVEEVKKSIPDFLKEIFSRATCNREEERYQTIEPFLHEFIQAIKSQGILNEGDWDFVSFNQEKLSLDQLSVRITNIEKILRRHDALLTEVVKRFDRITIILRDSNNNSQTQRIKSSTLNSKVADTHDVDFLDSKEE